MRDADKEIIEFTAEYFGISFSLMMSETRLRRVAWPRQCAFLLMRDLLTRNYSDIGRAFGARHHTTVLWGIKAVLKRKLPHERAFLTKAKTHFRQKKEQQ